MKPLLFGKYCLLERVSVGGMAEVFRAKPFDAPDFRGYLALKRILPHLAEDNEFIKMFVDEAKLTVQLDHPNIVRIYELGQFQQSYYILMEYISGKDVLALQKTMRRQRDIMPVDMSMFIAAEIARGLHHAHHKRDEDGNPLNIIHRDVSPQNVLIDYRGRVKVIDFGIAKAAVQSTRTQIGVLKGKMGYMSPEQVRGEVLDYRSDVFAIGTVLWEMLTNRRLFHADGEFETMQLVRDAIADPPSVRNELVPPEVDAIVMGALTRDPEQRYESAAAMADAIDGWLAVNPYTTEDLSIWMRTIFADDLDEERQKRDDFASIVTPDDVRRLQEQELEPPDSVDPSAPNNGEAGPPELEEWARDSVDEPAELADVDGIWVGGEAPEEGQDINEFADQHTTVQAGGFDAADAADDSAEFATLETQTPLGGFAAVTGPRDPVENSSPDYAPAPQPNPVHQPQHTASEFTAADTNASRPPEASPPRGFYVIAALSILLLLVGVGAAAVAFLIEEPAPEAKSGIGTIVIVTTPSDAVEISVDGALVATASPFTVSDLAPKKYVVEVKHPEYLTFSSNVEVVEGKASNVNVELDPRSEPPGFLVLRLPDERQEMEVFVNGARREVEAGKNPTFELDAGRHLVEVLQQGFRPWSLVTNVEPSVRREEVVAPEPIGLTLEIQADRQSSVRVGSNSLGRGVVAATELDPTQIHKISVTYRGQGVSNWSSYDGLPRIAQGSLEVNFDKPTPKTYRQSDFGYLQASTGDDWWEVLIDDAEIGLTTPIDARSKLPITPGKHKLTLRRGGITHDKEIEIQRGETFLWREKLDFTWDPNAAR